MRLYGQIARMTAARTVMLFADYVCPFSYLAVTSLEAVAAQLGLAVQRRAFELSPMPARVAQPATDEAWAIVRELAENAGLPIQRPAFVPRTRKAHEIVKFAELNGMGAAMDQAVFAAYFGRGSDIGRIDVLVEIATSLGLDPMLAKIALDLDTHTDAVLLDRAEAERLEITGTPALAAGAEVHVGLLSEQQLREWLGD
jgi:predicted DsbA family dithiol-disulfide isomerase